ncbi:MAG: toll/interleukin-1 receptor domain-containing protein [Pseudomonadota bacterium]
MSEPIKTFISYAREDERFCQELMNHLRSLEEDKLIEVWFDQGIHAGDSWRDKIQQQLGAAELFLFLWSVDAFNSEFIRKQEFAAARDRVADTRARIVSIVLRDFDQESRFGNLLRQWQMLPRDGVAIQHKRGRDRPWQEIVTEIRAIVVDISGRHPCEEFADGARSAVPDTAAMAPVGNQTARQIGTVARFWQQAAALEQAGAPVIVQGTLSQFAPMMIGPPQAKAMMHKDFRELLSEHAEEGEGRSASIDACLSMTAGQMVMRTHAANAGWHYFGLYNSIVRNSIPTFISTEYLERTAATLFQPGRRTVEAIVTGKIARTSNQYVLDYLSRYRLENSFRGDTLESWARAPYCLVIDGDQTGIIRDTSTDEPRYLDGDIWVAVKPPDADEIFETTFLNVADPDLRRHETRRLIRAVDQRHGPHASIIAQYDEWSEIDAIIDTGQLQPEDDLDGK